MDVAELATTFASAQERQVAGKALLGGDALSLDAGSAASDAGSAAAAEAAAAAGGGDGDGMGVRRRGILSSVQNISSQMAGLDGARAGLKSCEAELGGADKEVARLREQARQRGMLAASATRENCDELLQDQTRKIQELNQQTQSIQDEMWQIGETAVGRARGVGEGVRVRRACALFWACVSARVTTLSPDSSLRWGAT